MQKEKAKVIKEAKERGWFLYRQSRHEIYKHKKGGCVIVSKTESKERVWKEVKKDFMRQERKYHLK